MNLIGVIQYSLLSIYELVLFFTFKAYTIMDNRDREKKIYIFLSLIVLALLSMFRSENVGNDTDNYISMFLRISILDSNNLLFYMKDSVTEPGFILYTWLLSRVTQNPQILFIVSGAIVYASISYFIYKYISAPGLACFSMVALVKFDFFLSTIRQGIAIAILLVAFSFVLAKRPIPFVLLTAFAFFFHYSSIVFLLIYVIYHSNYSNTIVLNMRFYIVWSLIIFAIMIGFQQVIFLLLRLFPKYSYYEGTALFDGEPRIALFLQVLVYVTLYILTMVLLTDKEKKDPKTKLLTFLALLNISFIIIATNATALNRLSSTLTLFPIAHYSTALTSQRIGYKQNQVIVVVASILLFYLYGMVIVMFKTPDWYSTYPYSFTNYMI